MILEAVVQLIIFTHKAVKLFMICLSAARGGVFQEAMIAESFGTRQCVDTQQEILLP